MEKKKFAILINPFIFDTQYWARWSMPHGLLKIASWLQKNNYDIKLIDCLNPYGEGSKVDGKPIDYEGYDIVRKEKRSVIKLGTNIETLIEELPYNYKLNPDEKWKFHFGLSHYMLNDRLRVIEKDIRFKGYGQVEIWITSIMTYWWESTIDVVKEAFDVFPNAKIRIGGIYPTLAPDHLVEKFQQTFSRPIEKITGKVFDTMLNNNEYLNTHYVVTGEVPGASDLDLMLDLYEDNERPPYTILTTSRGCPHICAYCASNVLNGGTKVRNRTLDDVIAEIKEKFRNGTRVFCFYEDNLLMKMNEFKTILRKVLDDQSLKGIKLYAPEGVEIGVALSDKKRFLLKLDSNKQIIATFSLDGNKNPETGETELSLIMEEDLTHGNIEVIAEDADTVTLRVGGQDTVILQKIKKTGNRHEVIYINKSESKLGLYVATVPEVIYLMKLCGFDRFYLPLETIKKETNARWNRSWNSNLARFETLLNSLIEVGYNPRKQNINAFVMFGLPGEDIEEIYDTVLYASQKVGSVIPMLFTPVPSTMVFDQYKQYIEENKFDLQHLNGKNLPFFNLLKKEHADRHEGQELKIEDYLRLESFMQRINSKVNGESVDIYGDDRVSRQFRESFVNYSSVKPISTTMFINQL